MKICTQIVLKKIFKSPQNLYLTGFTGICMVTPTQCFYKSGITSISNIDNVKIVEVCAFGGSKLKSIVWPSKCDAIPDCCFGNRYSRSSSLREITNIEHVTKIGEGAFTRCKVEQIWWPAGCKTIPIECFLSVHHLKPFQTLKTLRGLAAVHSGEPTLLNLTGHLDVKKYQETASIAARLKRFTM